MSAQKKHTEGLNHLATAEKHLKTGFFKWKPDYDSAIDEYTKAATAFRNSKSLEEAASAYVKAANAQKANGSPFHAAKCLESAGLQYKDLKQYERCVDVAHEAATLYLEHGVPDTAAIALEKAAKMVEFELPMKAVELYRRLSDVGEQESRPRLSAEAMGRVGRICIRQKKLQDAAKALSQEIECYNMVENNGLVNRLTMGLVLVYLHLGDSVAASKVYHGAMSYPGFAESDESTPIGAVIQGFENQDEDSVRRALNNPLFRNMENDFVKLGRDLRVPGGGRKKEPEQTPTAAVPFDAQLGDHGASASENASAPQPAAADDDDEYDLK